MFKVKGRACALHLTPEWQEGYDAGTQGITKNPYDFWNEYTKHYAWDIGNQGGKKDAIQRT